MVNEVMTETKDKMKKSVEVLKKSYQRVRTGRASLSLLDGVRVKYYGTPTPLKQVASLTIPDPKTIMIQPWDPSVLGEIDKAILKSELGLTPANDGKVIRINIPPLTEERRKELVKLVRKMAEESRVAIRNIRREANEMLKELKKEKEISEDEMHRAQNEVQKITDKFIEQIDEICEEKEKEIMEI